jgi:hypothetical protein
MGLFLAPDTCPRDALQSGYDFGKKLRTWGFVPAQFAAARRLWVDQPHSEHALISYVRVGFTAGYRGQPLPDVALPQMEMQLTAKAG